MARDLVCLVTRKFLWRLCGYGETASDRYLDDQAYKVHNNTSRAILCELKFCALGSQYTTGSANSRPSSVFWQSG